jgi:hypothetical protein
MRRASFFACDPASNDLILSARTVGARLWAPSHSPEVAEGLRFGGPGIVQHKPPLTGQLGEEPTVFPGGYSGTFTHPGAYTGRLHEVLSTY